MPAASGSDGTAVPVLGEDPCMGSQTPGAAAPLEVDRSLTCRSQQLVIRLLENRSRRLRVADMFLEEMRWRASSPPRAKRAPRR